MMAESFEINKIYCEDNLSTMARMDNNFIDMVLTSPPYDDLRDYTGYVYDFIRFSSEVYRVLKQGGVFVYVIGDSTKSGSETLTSFRHVMCFKERGFNIHDTMIYKKDVSPFPESNRYSNMFEFMFVMSKGSPKTFNPLMTKNKSHGVVSKNSFRCKDGSVISKKLKVNDQKNIGNVWDVSAGYMKTTKDVIAYEHPAMFPEKIAINHIYSWSKEGDLIYDPFMGSGTTAKAAHLLKRNWIGSEISEKYVELANKRLDPYLRQQTIF